MFTLFLIEYKVYFQSFCATKILRFQFDDDIILDWSSFNNVYRFKSHFKYTLTQVKDKFFTKKISMKSKNNMGKCLH